MRILLGGSPCTNFSIAQKKNRETEPNSGVGWELFKNYLIAKEKFHPDIFLYENNESASQAIKDEISKSLEVELLHINSALVSAQQRKRIYGVNFKCPLPEDRHICLDEILEYGAVDRQKGLCLCSNHCGNTRDYFKKHQTQIAYQPVLMSVVDGKRVYSCMGKSTCLLTKQDGFGESYYLTPIPDKIKPYICEQGRVYAVKGGEISTHLGLFPCGMSDGNYVIRKLTVTECERLQTLPDGYCNNVPGVNRGDKYKGIGNGWTAEVIKHLLCNGLNGVPRDTHLDVLSMYDGIATGLYCLKAIGFTNITYKAYEIDKAAMMIANYNHPEIIQCGDAFQVREENWTY